MYDENDYESGWTLPAWTAWLMVGGAAAVIGWFMPIMLVLLVIGGGIAWLRSGR